jgi:hypothetical protein
MTSSVEMNPQKETASEAPLVAVSEEAAADAKSKLCKKDKILASTSLEAHQAMFSLSDISMFFSHSSEYVAFILTFCSFCFSLYAEVPVSWR